MKVVIILPTYNERENIITLLDELNKINSKIKYHKFFYLVVDDNSPDKTADMVREYQKKFKEVYLLTGEKQGLGKALLRGLEYATNKLHAEILIQMDADLSHDPAVLPNFIKAIENGADFVVGSRYIRGGSIPDNWGIHRKIFSIVGNAIVRYGLGFSHIHDWTGGYRAYRREFFDSAKEHMSKFKGYVYQIAFLHKAVLNRAKVVEVPIKFTDRRFGHSKIAPSEYIRNVLWYVAKSRFLAIFSGTFGKFLVVGTVGFVINTIILEFFVSVGAHPLVGSLVGAEMAIISNFILNHKWTFRSRNFTDFPITEKFLQFNFSSFGAILLQGISIGLGTYIFGKEIYRWFYIIGIGLGLIWNYIMYSKVIWRKK